MSLFQCLACGCWEGIPQSAQPEDVDQLKQDALVWANLIPLDPMRGSEGSESVIPAIPVVGGIWARDRSETLGPTCWKLLVEFATPSSPCAVEVG